MIFKKRVEVKELFIYGKNIPLEDTPISTSNLDPDEYERDAISHMFTYGVDIPLEYEVDEND